MRLLDDLIGKEIIDTEAKIVGKIKDIEIDASNNKIESIISIEKIDKIIGHETKESIIPFEMIQKIGDKVILKDENSLDSLLYSYEI